MFGDKLNVPVFESAGLLAAAVLAIVVANLAASKKEKEKKRRLSFSSSNLYSGSFPKDAAVCPPIVNNLCIFEKCPIMENIMPAASTV